MNDTQDKIELYRRDGMFNITKQGENDAKSSVTAIAPAKRVKDIFGLTGQAVTLKRDEAGRALKTLAVMTVGALSQSPTVICTRISSRVGKNGDVSHILSFKDKKALSKQEAAIAASIGMSVEEFQQRKLEVLSKQKPIEMQKEQPTEVAA